MTEEMKEGRSCVLRDVKEVETETAVGIEEVRTVKKGLKSIGSEGEARCIEVSDGGSEVSVVDVAIDGITAPNEGPGCAAPFVNEKDASSSPSGANGSVDRRCCPSTEEEYDVLLERFSRVRESATFEFDDHHARSYFRMKVILGQGSMAHLSKHAQCKYLACKFSIKLGTVEAWIMSNKIPRHVGWLGRLERKRLGLVKPRKNTRDAYLPKSLEEYEALLRRHPYVREHPDFATRDRYARIYFEIVAIREKGRIRSFPELSDYYGIPLPPIFVWFHEQSVPDIFHQLASSERQRVNYEAKISKPAWTHRIDPSIVYKVLLPLRDRTSVNAKELAQKISKICGEMSERDVVFFELFPYNRKLGPRWLLDIGKAVKTNLRTLENILNSEDTGECSRYRLGYANRTLYIWKRRIEPFAYLKLLGDECFYFNNVDRRKFLYNLRKHLNIHGMQILTQLLQQITRVREFGRGSESAIGADVRHDREHIFGETLAFILDVTGEKLHDIGGKIRAIGQQEQIFHPRIIEGEDLLELMARLYAITASDGHVGDLWNFLGYHEYNEDRVEIVKGLVQRFGDVRWSYFHDDGRIAGLRFPHVLGRLMKKLGIPTGDKCLQNYGLPQFILNGSLRVKCAYLEEVIPEDGWLKISSISQAIGIARNKALFDPEKYEHYKFKQKITDSHIKIIKKYGTPRVESDLIKGTILGIGKLRKLAKSKDLSISRPAKELLLIAQNNRISLLEDEYRVVQDIGIVSPKPRLQGVYWYEKTGRVSSAWSFVVSRQSSIAKWGLLAPPNDVYKRKILARWMVRKAKIVGIVRRQIQLEYGYSA